MAGEAGSRLIPRGTPASAAMVAEARRAMAITARINRLGFEEAAEVRTLMAELICRPLDDAFTLIPPFFATGGLETRIGRNVFVNQNCTFYDLGGIEIGDDVMIGPNVSLITSGHPLDPARRRAGVTAAPIVIGANVWIAAGVTVIGGVRVGANSVVAAGSIVTRDVPPDTLVGGNPARVIRILRSGEGGGRDLGDV
ncbi:sugar O-acetyltransferase [Solirhodobacter olei]|uniref:sugar O-acetyltransferase n=1 Tax=Solirhodobacter olei TaxID=2493082 RepID=UPI000FD7D3CC|nr:sugar O-acetyltransferase [Solirhodobacter olei]